MADKKLTGMKVLIVLAPDQFRDEELLQPKEILSGHGAHVTVASTRAGEAHGMLGATVTPDTVVDKEQATDYHGIVVVGGMGSPEFLWNNASLHKLLKDCQQQGKVVAGICLSGAVLANAGVLSGKRATVWATPESVAALEKGKAQYTKDHVVADGSVVTADGPEAASQFGEAVATALQKVASRV
jgi:protease I